MQGTATIPEHLKRAIRSIMVAEQSLPESIESILDRQANSCTIWGYFIGKLEFLLRNTCLSCIWWPLIQTPSSAWVCFKANDEDSNPGNSSIWILRYITIEESLLVKCFNQLASLQTKKTWSIFYSILSLFHSLNLINLIMQFIILAFAALAAAAPQWNDWQSSKCETVYVTQTPEKQVEYSTV